jgi:hypothetical protein
MIASEKAMKAVRAIQGVLIVGRAMAHKGEPLERVAVLLDRGEYLPGLILAPTEETLTFDEYLADIVRDFPQAQWILDEYRA